MRSMINGKDITGQKKDLPLTVIYKGCHRHRFTSDKNPVKDCIIAKFSIRNFKDERLTLSGRTQSIGRSFRHLSNIISTLPQHSCHGGQSRKMSQYKHCRNESIMSSNPGWNASLQYSASPGTVSHKLSIRSHGWLWPTHHQPYTTFIIHNLWQTTPETPESPSTTSHVLTSCFFSVS